MKTWTYSYTITLPFEEGVYFFQNKETENYMQIDDNDAPGYNTEGSILELWSLDGYSDYEAWNILHVEDEYYKI